MESNSPKEGTAMTDTLLIYPYFQPAHDRSVFRFPPLGLGYIASYLRMHGVSVEIVDCTFIGEDEALRHVKENKPSVIGIYSMYTMEENSLRFARRLRKECDTLVAGGPLPTISPEKFLQDFDLVAIGEGEQTMLEIVNAFKAGDDFSKINGITYKKTSMNGLQQSDSNEKNSVTFNPQRQFISDLDSIPFPARDLFQNNRYIAYHKKVFGDATTSLMTSRGCPFNCDFCSKPVFGDTTRMRSPGNVVDEIEDIISYGYDCIFFQDDCFTLDEQRVTRICEEILDRGLGIRWRCLSRVDSVQHETLLKMKKAGCERIFFGIESGNDSVLKIMNKQFTTDQARAAVESVASTGIETGAFFILGYPGETDQTVLDTVSFAASLPLDYASFTMPYPIPGTGLYEKVRKSAKDPMYTVPKSRLIDHSLNFESNFSETKLKFAILKAAAQIRMRKHLPNTAYTIIGKPFEALTYLVFKALK